MFVQEITNRSRLFASQPYMCFALSGVLATFGNGLIYITMSWYAFEQTQSVASVALLMFCVWAPSILFGPVFGVCADRYNRKTLMVLSNGVRGVAAIGFAWLLANGHDASIYMLATLLGTFVSFYMPAALPLIAEIVPKKHLVEANATVDMLYELGTIVGMGVSGFLLVYFGVDGTFAVGGVCFVVAAFFNGLMRYQSAKAVADTPSGQQAGFIADYLAALVYLRKHPFLIKIYSVQMLIMVLLMTIPVLLIPYVTDVFSADAKQFAYFEALFSVGVFMGGLVSPMILRKQGARLTLAVLCTIMAVGLVVFSHTNNVWLAYVVYAFVGLGLSSWAIAVSQAQLLTDNAYQGRLQATFYSISGVGILLIYLLLTIYSQAISVKHIYLLQGLICVGILLLLTRLPGLNADTQEATDA